MKPWCPSMWCLFTNVPIALAVEMAGLHLSKDDSWKQVRGLLNPTDVYNLLSACLSSTYFVFDGIYHKQVFRTTMGSPEFAVGANMVMEELEDRAIPALTTQPSVWYRYVDDTFDIRHSEVVNTRHEAINNTFPSISFTHEKEQNGSIAFLDTMVTRGSKGRLNHTVYRKPTHTDG